MSKRLLTITLVALSASAVFASSAFAELPNQRTDMKVLLLTATGTEPSAQAWQAALAREGVPYDKLVLGGDREALSAETFADTLDDGTPRAKYQGVVVATGGLVYENNGAWISAMTTEEWSLLANYTATYGVRQVTASIYPNAGYGLNTPSYAGPATGQMMQVTTAGRTVFPELVGRVPIDAGSWGYFATPLATFQPGESFTTLLTVSQGRTVMGVFNHADGREELVFTIDSNQYQMHSMLLSNGLVGWLTKGRFMGFKRNYLAMQVDDVFVETEVWDAASNTNGQQAVRMRPADVSRSVRWSALRGQRLDIAFNGAGNVDAGGPGDRLLRSFQSYKASFGFVNHTFRHTDFDDVDDDPSNGLQPADVATINNDIRENIDWANSNGIPINADELVTGEHSGVHTNPAFSDAVAENALAWIGDDNSRYPAQQTIGAARTVPRHPTNVYYNTSTREQQLDEYNYLYLPPELGGSCVNTAVTTCMDAPITWTQYVDAEATTIVRHMLTNDPRPHYAHQANLTGDRILISVLDATLRRYGRLVTTPVVQPDLTAAGRELQRRRLWADEQDSVTAYLRDGVITLTSHATVPLEVPLSGSATTGELDASGRRSGWLSLQPGETIELPVVT
ncbi:MAG: hypothetical protein WAO61_07515 [Solirubrobacterales bacterium]